VGTRCADHVTPLYPQKLALTSPTGGGRSVGIVRSRTKAAEFFLIYFTYIFCFPSDRIYTLSWWRGWWVPVTLRAKPEVALLPVGSPKPDRSRGYEPDEEKYLEEGNFDKIPLMPVAASSVTTWSPGQMMIEMVQDLQRIIEGKIKGDRSDRKTRKKG